MQAIEKAMKEERGDYTLDKSVFLFLLSLTLWVILVSTSRT